MRPQTWRRVSTNWQTAKNRANINARTAKRISRPPQYGRERAAEIQSNTFKKCAGGKNARRKFKRAQVRTRQSSDTQSKTARAARADWTQKIFLTRRFATRAQPRLGSFPRRGTLNLFQRAGDARFNALRAHDFKHRKQVRIGEQRKNNPIHSKNARAERTRGGNSSAPKFGRTQVRTRRVKRRGQRARIGRKKFF